MNERIVDLYEQASLFASEEENPTKSYKDRVMIKFAELIVEECIELNKQELAFNAFERMLNRYKEHFGVEE
jgi:hypothetical protein